MLPYIQYAHPTICIKWHNHACAAFCLSPHLHTQNGGAQHSVLGSMPEVHGRLLDILALLLARGVNPLVQDAEGNSPSRKASNVSVRDDCFLDGAVLIGK